MNDAQDQSPVERENTVESILAGFDGFYATIKDVDQVVDAQYARLLAEQLKAILDHADPGKGGFSSRVEPTQHGAFIWTQMAAACQEITLAWNLNRMAALAGARRSLRVALEYLSTGVLEGLPLATVRRFWTHMPKGDMPIWKMTLPVGHKEGNGLGRPLVDGSKFAHGLKAVLPEFPNWDGAMVVQLDGYMKSHLHAFAHGSAGALSLMLTGTSNENPRMGIMFDASHPEAYSSTAHEIVQFGAMCRHILDCASEYLKSVD